MFDDDDPLIAEAIQFVLANRKASISGVQRHFRIGYNRAALLLESMEIIGVVSAPGHNGNREVLLPSDTPFEEIDFSSIGERKLQMEMQENVRKEKARQELNSVEYQAKIEAITNKKIVIWLHDTKEKSNNGDPIYILCSYSPFEELANKQKRDKLLDLEPSGDILAGYKFRATMQLRTPTKVLKQHGRMEKKPIHKLPRIITSDWQGMWSAEAKTFREIGVDIDDMPMGTMASEIGQVPADGGDFLRFMLFAHQIKSENISYEEKIKWFEIAYNMVGLGGEPIKNFMEKYGETHREMILHIMHSSWGNK